MKRLYINQKRQKSGFKSFFKSPILVLWFLVLNVSWANGDCSSYLGKAFFNEVYATQKDAGFLEVVTKGIDSDIPKSEKWTVFWCLSNNNNSCKTENLNSANTSDAYGEFYFYDFAIDAKANELTGFQAVLLDGSGNVIDFLKINSTQATYANISNKLTCSITHSTSPPSAGNDDRHFYRDPDGTGPWVTNSKSGASSQGDITKGAPNNPDLIIGKTPRLGSFTVVDRSPSCNAVANWENNITTKIAGESKDFWLLAKDMETSEVMGDADIRVVKLKHYSTSSSGVCSGTLTYERTLCENCGITNSDGCLALNGVVFENRASKCAAFYIEGVDNNVSGALDTNATSIDNFAIRPDRFYLEAPLSAYAAERFVLNTSAYNYGNTQNTLGYNESISSASSVRIDANETNIACRDALEAFDYNESRSFLDGVANAIEARHSGLARPLTIKIEELNGSEFAFVDRDDTADALRFITPYELNVTIYPYELNVTRSEIDASIAGSEWIYMADVKDMNITLLAEVTAFNKNGVALRDFNSTCYAQNVDIAFGLTTDGSAGTNMNYLTTTYFDANISSMGKNATLADINQTLAIPRENFVDGRGLTTMSLNVDRDFANPLNPFYIGGVATTIKNPSVAKVIGNELDVNDRNITLYFGKVKTSDIETTQNPVKHFAEIEVYDNLGSSYVDGLTQNSLKWYINKNHTSVEYGEVRDANASTNTIKTSPAAFNEVPTLANDGKFAFDLEAPSFGRYVMHLNISPWLWHGAPSFSDDYNESVGSGCLAHPCFTYAYKDASLSSKISSGEFKGSDADLIDRGDYVKKGVKVFR